MVDRAVPEATGTARDRVSHNTMKRLMKRRPASIFRRAKERDARRSYGVGDMSRAGVIADKEIKAIDQGGKPS